VALGAVFSGTGLEHPADPVAYGLSGFFQAQLGAAVLGALAITSEYATGLIRTTLTATPQRLAVLGAKAIVVASTMAVVGVAAAFLAFFVAAQIYDGRGVAISLGDPGALRSVVGAGLYLAVLAVLALALGVLLRSSVGTVAVVVGLTLVLPGIATALPTDWQDVVLPYLPAEAGQALIGETRFAPAGDHLLGPWAGFAVFCAYTVVALAAALVTLSRRDSR